MPNARVLFLEMRGGCGCARVYGFPILFKILRPITRPLAREEERLAHTSRSLPAADLRPERKLKKEKRTARAVCMGAATSLRMTRTAIFGFWI
jgi:hypothetical protein